MPIIPEALTGGSRNFIKSICIFAIETGVLHLSIHSPVKCTKFKYEYIFFFSPSQVIVPGFLISVNIMYSYLSLETTLSTVN